MRIKLLTAFFFTFFYHITDAQNVILRVSLKTSAAGSPQTSATGSPKTPTARSPTTSATGSLKISAPQPPTNASIQLYSLPDTSLLQSQVSRTGINTFSIKPSARYLLKVSAIGFETIQKLITVTDKPVSVTITLSTKSSTLNTVTVVATKPLVRQEDDKTIVDAEVLANSSTSAYEVLEKAPGLVLDQDGNVYITSSSPAAIYINGRQMRMGSDDIVSLLKSLPAGSISRIEIIRTPSAKYDAANSGGIVNVVLKKGIKIGTAGSVNVRYDQGVYGTLSTGFSLNHSIGKINSYISYQYTKHNYYDDIRSDRLLNADSLLMQHSSTRYSTTTNYVGAGIDLECSKRTDLSYDMRLTANNNNSNAVSNNDLSETTSKNEFYQSQTPIGNKGRSFFISNSLTSKYKIDSLGSEWSNEIDYTYTDNHSSQLYTNNYLLPVAPAEDGDGTTHSPSNMVDLKTDLSLKLKYRLLLETGGKISDVTNNNKALFYTQTGNQPRQVDPYQTNTFRYKENISSAYLQLSETFRGTNFKAGLRFENTAITGNQYVPADTSFSIRRNDLFPYFYIKRPLFKVLGYPLTGNAIYRRSITRPGYAELNPSPVFVDPFTYNVGNPKLQPQFTTNYEINSTYDDFPVFAIGVNNTKDIFSQVTYQNDTSNIAYRTYDNLGRYKEIYGRLFGGLPAGGKYFMYAGVQFNHIQYTGEYQGTPLNFSRGSWTFFTGHEVKASPTLKFNLNAWMYVNGFRTFYELKTLGQVNVNITKSLLDKKLSIILSGNDILRTSNSTFHLQQGTVLVNGTREQDSRRFGLTLRYNFGIAHKDEKKELFTQPPPVNTDPNQ